MQARNKLPSSHWLSPIFFDNFKDNWLLSFIFRYSVGEFALTSCFEDTTLKAEVLKSSIKRNIFVLQPIV